MPSLVETRFREPGHAIEVNFVIAKFLKWDPGAQKQLYLALQKNQTGAEYLKAGCALECILTEANPSELVDYVNRSFGSVERLLDEYVPGLVGSDGVAALAAHFREHLRLEGDKFMIEKIEVPTRSTK